MLVQTFSCKIRKYFHLIFGIYLYFLRLDFFNFWLYLLTHLFVFVVTAQIKAESDFFPPPITVLQNKTSREFQGI